MDVPNGLIDLFEKEGKELDNEDHWGLIQNSTTSKGKE
jgi:hypothetical protein